MTVVRLARIGDEEVVLVGEYLFMEVTYETLAALELARELLDELGEAGTTLATTVSLAVLPLVVTTRAVKRCSPPASQLV